jgi:hypothetical protein
VLDGECDNTEQTSLDEVREQASSRRCLKVLCNRRTLVDEMDTVDFLLDIGVFRVEYGEQLPKKRCISLEMLQNIDLVEEDKRVED